MAMTKVLRRCLLLLQMGLIQLRRLYKTIVDLGMRIEERNF